MGLTRVTNFKNQYSHNSHYETNFGFSSTAGAGKSKIGFLKASLRLAFKKPILIMGIAVEHRT
jgi:hypothetical protein